MKTVLTIICLLLALQIFSQATTQTEYNYMKKGYRQVEENGLDVKQGYTTEVLSSTLYGGEVTLTFTSLKRNNGSLAGIIIKSVSQAAFGSGTNYYCIPAVHTKGGQSFGWNDFYSDINTMTNGVKTYILRWMSYQLMYELATKKKPVFSDSTMRERIQN